MKKKLQFLVASALLWGGPVTVQAEIKNGECGAVGANVTWTLNTETGVLEISGTGAMKDFKSFAETPWVDYSSVITSVSVGNGVTAVGNHAFSDCMELTNLRIEDGSETLEFTDCSEEHMPFADCPLDTVYLGRNISYDSNYSPFKDKRNLVSLTIGNQVTVIGDYAFDGCWNLALVTIPNNVTIIGESAFYLCRMTSVTIGNGVTSIGNDAFSYSGLKSVTLYATNPPEIQNSFVESGVYVYVPAESIALYKAADGWKNLNIRYKIDGIGYDILSSDERTAEVINGGYSGDVVIPETMEYEGITYRVTAIGDDAFYYCTGLTSVTIPESITAIGDGAFDRCTDLTSVTIPENVTSIGDDAFFGCEGLTSVTIPKSVTAIGNGVFDRCTGLTSVTIPESITAIGDGAFAECANLTSLTIGGGVTSIGRGAFEGCSGLTLVTIPESVTTIDEAAFYGCSNLERFDGKFAADYGRCLIVNDTLKAFALNCGVAEYTIPEDVTTISAGTFRGCSSLTSITIPESVTAIGHYTFFGCSGLTSLTIGSGVTTIGNVPFYGCKLTSITAYNPTPIDDISTFAFLGVDYDNCTLYVPAESVELYKAAEGWSKFGTILPIDESSAITETRQDNADGHVTVYNLQGVPVLETDDAADLKTLRNGAYIVNGKKMIIAR